MNNEELILNMLGTMQKSITDIQTTVGTMQNDITDMKGEIADMKGEIASIKERLDDIDETLECHTTALNELLAWSDDVYILERKTKQNFPRLGAHQST